MNMLKYTQSDMTPEVYRGGGGLGGLLESTLSVITLGASDAIFGVDAPTLPDAPKGPENMTTGQTVKEGGVSTLDEEKDAKKNARKTARKGTAKFRIPLASTATGVKASGGSGLKI